jgi:altronate hydrolase
LTGASSRPEALHLDGKDNVAVVLRPIGIGQVIVVDGISVTAVDPIPEGHKIALREIAVDEPVVKYGEPIGKATASIAVGAHVHIQNTVSLRLPGPGAPRR